MVPPPFAVAKSFHFQDSDKYFLPVEKFYKGEFNVDFVHKQDGSTMLIESAKGGHTNVVSYLLDYPNNVPATEMSQLTPPSHDTSQVRTMCL